MTEWTLSSLHRKAYGQWAGQPQGQRPDPNLCCKSVIGNERGALPHQCGKKRGFGPEQAYCAQHNPEKVKERQAKATAEYNAKMEQRRIEWAGKRFFEALCKIADGDNDPRATAAAAIKEFRK